MRREMGGWIVWLSVGAALLTLCQAQRVNHCIAAQASRCSECIQAGKGCTYCSDESFDFPRCDFRETLTSNGCTMMTGVESMMKTDKNTEINTKLNVSQVAPQLMTMHLVPGEERELLVDVFEPEKGPLDLYILMDFSNSMKDDLLNLKKMGNSLANLVGQLSDDYTIGFGKFVDKVTEPQTSMSPSKLKQPWPDSDPPFSFQNTIPLTNNITLFTEKLKKERISGNLDAPEGGFDAILQAAVCQEQIGWRENSTHLLVFSTESAFHYEADGANVLAGILPRNDEACHLAPDGFYTYDTRQDYPSVPTLVRLLGKHNIIPIFAVTNYSYSYYEKLYQYFPIADIGELQEDSSNILTLIGSAFINIRSKISLRAEDRPKAVETQFLSTTGSMNKDGTFTNVPGKMGTFKLRVKAHSSVGEEHVCQLPEADRKGAMRVKPTTFTPNLKINTEVLCATCDCEKKPQLNAAKCNGNGDLICGMCYCHPGWLGASCNCSAVVSSLDNSKCTNSSTGEVCSGKGDCQCGTCTCHHPHQYEGPYCQFDKSQCQRFGGFLCNENACKSTQISVHFDQSGGDRGRCYMGSCACEEGWEGAACECPKSNDTCVDSEGGICNGRGYCKCGRCHCESSRTDLGPTCEINFQAQLGMCEDRRSCVQCQAWKTGERKGDKCDGCPFKITMVDKLPDSKDAIETCSFRDEDDDCTFHYSVLFSSNPGEKDEVQVLKKKECPPGAFLWLIPLIMFLMLLLGLLLLCCWKYCRCCRECLALLPCCARGRVVGFKEDQYMLRQSTLASDHLDTPLVRTGPPKSTDVVRWKITDNVHRGASHPQAQVVPSPKETIQYPISLRLNRLFTDSLSHPDARDTEMLCKEVEDNLNEVYKQIPGAQKVKKTIFRKQPNAGKRQNHTVVDTVLPAPRAAYNDIVNLTERSVQAGTFSDLKVVPGYYTVATDREAKGAVEMQEGVESVDVRVPLFIKDEDDDKKQLRVEALDVPIGIAEIGRRFVNITVIKEHAKSILTFLQPSYSYSRQEKVANIPVNREIYEDGQTQVTYRTRDLTAKDKKDYISMEGDLTFLPGEVQKTIPVKLLEWSEDDSLLGEKQVKQFVMDLTNPRQGAKLGRYPRTTVTIMDSSEPSVVTFKKSTQTFNIADAEYSVPVQRTTNLDTPATVHWRTRKASRFNLQGALNFAPGESKKNVVIKPRAHPGPVKAETFQLELYDPSSNTILGDKKTTLVNVSDSGDGPELMEILPQTAQSPGGRLTPPGDIKAAATGPRNIHLNWAALPGNPLGYKVKYWIQGDPEADAQVIDCKKTQAELTNLYPYCDYEMRVCGYNSMGNGQYSSVVQCQTQEDVPGEPGRLAFNVISPTVTQLSWAEPAETNGIITAYEVTYTPIDENNQPIGPTKKVKIDNPRKRMLLIENLQPSQTYCYNVRACNSVGWGPYRDATINLATQPNRPMSIPIIPDIPIVDAEAGEGYDSYLMYSSDVLRSPGGRSSASDEGLRWKHVQLVGEDLDLRKVSWRLPADIIPRRLSSDTEVNDELPRLGRAQTPLQDSTMTSKWEQSLLYPGGPGSATRNLSTSSSTYSPLSPHGMGGATMQTTTTYLSGPGNSLSRRQQMMTVGGVRTEEVVLRKRSERGYYDSDGVRDSIVMVDVPGGFSASIGGSGYSRTLVNYSAGPGLRARTQSEDVADALQNLDRVLQDPRLTPGVPDTPTRLVFSALGPTALKVSWQEPHCENEVLGYCVLYQLLSGGEVKRLDVPGSMENSVVVQDLLPNQSYIFKVKAKSQEGWGPEREGVITIESAVDPRSPLSPMPGSPFTLSTPSAPGPLVFTALSPDALRLSWDKPRKPNGDILGYVVTCEQLHGGGDMRTFQVGGDNAETSLTVSNLTENVPYKFKVQARTTLGFGPEREGIITIESQDGGNASQYSSQAMTRREVFNLPGEISTRTNVTHTTFNDPYFSDGMKLTTQHVETGGMVTRHITKEVVTRTVAAGNSMTKKVEKFYEA